MKKIFILIFCFFSVVQMTYAARTPDTQPAMPNLGNACPALTANTYGVKILGANSTVSDIVINACVAMGEDAALLKTGRGGKVCALTSGYRSAGHNASVGGAKQSQHIQGNAVDVVLLRGDVLRFGELLHAGLCCKNRCLGGLGYYNGNKYHVDNRQGIKAWGPGYSKNGIPQITHAGVRNLLYTHLRNSGSIQLPNGAQAEIATGEITNNPLSAVGIPSLSSQMATEGQNEDGNWATNAAPQMVMYQQPQSVYQQVSPQQETLGNYPMQQQVQQRLPENFTQTHLASEPVADIQTTTPSPDDEGLGEGAYIRCEPAVLPVGSSATISWSCGSTGSGAKIVGRGFNPKNALIASTKITPNEVRQYEYGITCHNDSVRFYTETCSVDVVESTGSSSVQKNKKTSLFGNFCVFGFCFLGQ